MFSSNQTFEISGSMDQLKDVIDFGIRHAGCHEMLTRTERPVAPAFQIAPCGLYLIGQGGIKDDPGRSSQRIYEGWTRYPFDYDPAILSGIVKQWLESQPAPWSQYDGMDGIHETGFLCTAVNQLPRETREAISNPTWGILAFRPYRNWYAK